MLVLCCRDYMESNRATFSTPRTVRKKRFSNFNSNFNSNLNPNSWWVISDRFLFVFFFFFFFLWRRLLTGRQKSRYSFSRNQSCPGVPFIPGVGYNLIQRPCYQRGSLCQDPAGNRTARRPPDHRKETQIDVVWTCLPFIRFCQNHLARYSEGGKKTRQTEKEVGRQHQEMVRPGVRQVPEGSGEHRKIEETGCEVICGAPTTSTVKR